MTTRQQNQLLLVLFIGCIDVGNGYGGKGACVAGDPESTRHGCGNGCVDFEMYIVANLVFTPLLAKAFDRYGRRTSFLASIVVFGIGSMVVASATDVTWMLIGRSIQGFGAGGIFPMTSAVVGDVFPVAQRGCALGVIGAVFGIAFLIGPIVGGVLLFGWPWLFWINVPIIILIIVFGMRLLPVGGGKQGAPFDWLGIWS